MRYDVSVIICCYNSNLSKTYKTINSVVKQKNIKYEIIISDDGSKNNHKLEIETYCKQFKNIDFKFNFLTKNIGTIRNILSAVSISSGLYIKTLSPGDYFAKENALEKYFQKAIENDSDIVYSDTVFYCENKIVERNDVSHKKFIYNSNKIAKRFALYKCHFMGNAFIAKREVYDLLKPIEGKVLYLEDQAIIIQSYILEKKFNSLSEQLVWYEYGTGISTSKDKINNQRLYKDEVLLSSFIISNYKNEPNAKKIIRKLRYSDYKNRLVKYLLFLIFYPGYFIAKIQSVLSKSLNCDITIEDRDRITSLIEGNGE